MTKFDSIDDIVRHLKERADDIEKAVLYPPGGHIAQHGVPVSGPVDQFALVFHLTNNQQTVFGRTVEAILNDGILNRMRIPIELGVGR